MIVKVYNTNTYVHINPNDFVREKDYYHEIMRVQYNLLPISPNLVSSIKDKLNHTK
jgi:hypothetical protein